MGHPGRIVEAPGGVAGAVVVEPQCHEPRLGQVLGQSAEGAVRGSPLLAQGLAEHDAATHPAVGGPGHPPEQRSLLGAEPHLGVLGADRGHGAAQHRSDAFTSSGHATRSVPWVAKRASVTRSSPKPKQALWAALPSASRSPKV